MFKTGIFGVDGSKIPAKTYSHFRVILKWYPAALCSSFMISFRLIWTRSFESNLFHFYQAPPCTILIRQSDSSLILCMSMGIDSDVHLPRCTRILHAAMIGALSNGRERFGSLRIGARSRSSSESWSTSFLTAALTAACPPFIFYVSLSTPTW